MGESTKLLIMSVLMVVTGSLNTVFLKLADMFFFSPSGCVALGVRQAGRHADRRELRRGDGGQWGFLQPSVSSGAKSFAVPFRNF